VDKRCIKAGIQFVSYKIVKIDFQVFEQVGALVVNDQSDFDVAYVPAFRNAVRFIEKKQNRYVTGIKVELTIESKTLKKLIAKGEFIATGLFTADGTLDKQTEEVLATNQAPAILFPYIRAAISSVLNYSGFGNVLPMPLINVNEATKKLNLKVIDAQDSTK